MSVWDITRFPGFRWRAPCVGRQRLSFGMIFFSLKAPLQTGACARNVAVGRYTARVLTVTLCRVVGTPRANGAVQSRVASCAIIVGHLLNQLL